MNSQLRKRHVEFLKSGQLTTEVSLVATLLILMLSLAAHLFDFIGVWAFADVGSVVFTVEAVVFGIVSGILAAQVCLLAIWCSLGGQKGVLRLPLAITSVVLLVNNWILALSGGRANFNYVDVAVVFAGVFFVFVLVQLPLVMIRMLYKFSIAPTCLNSSRKLAPHFKIRDLFVLMFYAALLVVFTQIVVEVALTNSSIPMRNMKVSEVVDTMEVFLILGVSVSLISLITLSVVFSNKYRWQIVLLLLTILGISVLGSLIVPLFFLSSFSFVLVPVEAYQWFVFFNVVFWAELLILSVFYLLGYRARSTRNSEMIASN